VDILHSYFLFKINSKTFPL